MTDHCLWELEVEYLAQQWHPQEIKDVLRYFHRRRDSHRSDKAAFVDVYERYFLNPSAEGAQR